MMDREQYLKNLSDTLKESFTQQQTNDILADYSEFFDAGIAEGKSENELCTEFGSPKNVVRELLSNNSNQRQSLSLTQPINILTALVFIQFLLFPFLAQHLSFFPSASLFLLPLFLEAIIFVGNKGRIEPTKASSKFLGTLNKLCSGKPFYVIMLLTSITLGYYLSYDCIWLNSSPLDFWGYFIILALLAGIYLIQSNYPMKADFFRSAKIILILSFALIALFSCAIVFLLNKLGTFLNTLLQSDPSSGTEFSQLLETISILSALLFTLTIFTGILVTLYAIHKNTSLKWMIFLNTTILSLVINLFSVLSHGISDYSTQFHEIFITSRFAIAQNIAALALFLLFSLLYKTYQTKILNKRGI